MRAKNVDEIDCKSVKRSIELTLEQTLLFRRTILKDLQ